MDDTIAVIGAGMMGGAIVKSLLKSGYSGKIIAVDINEFRLKKAQEFGADETIYAKESIPLRVLEINENRLVDVVIVCTGAPQAFLHALKSVDRTGTLMFFAPTNPKVEIPVNIFDIWRNDIKIVNSYAAAPLDLSEAIKLISDKVVKVNDMITHKLPLKEASKGFQLVADAKDSIKVIIEPNK